MADLPPTYDDCPAACPEGNAPNCDDCPKRELRESFRQQTEEFLTERLGETWQKWGFENLLMQAMDVLALEKTSGLTLTAARLCDIAAAERQKMRRIDEWNERNKRQNAKG